MCRTLYIPLPLLCMSFLPFLTKSNSSFMVSPLKRFPQLFLTELIVSICIQPSTFPIPDIMVYYDYMLILFFLTRIKVS